MLREYMELLKELVSMSERIEKRLQELERLEAVITYLDVLVDCEEHEECYTTNGSYLKRLRDWLRLYRKVSTAKPDELLNVIPWSFEVDVDFSEMRLIEIRHKELPSDRLQLDVMLPLDEEGKKRVVEAARRKIGKIFEEMPEEYIRAMLTVAELLKTMRNVINSIQRQYEHLRLAVESMAMRLALGEK